MFLQKKISTIVLKLAQVNFADINLLARDKFGELEPGKPLPVKSFDDSLNIEVDGSEYRFTFPGIQEYSHDIVEDEVTIGCPAIYGQVGSQNAIRHMINYAVDLLKQSGVYQKIN